MRRGQVWWANLPGAAGRRPVVLLTRNAAYATRDLLTVAPVTSRIRNIHSEVLLGPEDGLPKRCVANLDTITTIGKQDLGEFIATLGPERMKEIDAALKYALGLSD